MIRSILLLLALAWPVSANDLFLSPSIGQLGTVTAFDQGRVKSLDSLAASVMGGSRPEANGTTNLTEMLVGSTSEAWTNRPTIYVKNKLVG